MQIGADQGRFMQLMATLIGARRYLEIGVYTGYSSLAIALALPPGGVVVACDVSAEYTAVARRYWKEAGVEGKIDLRLAPALQTLERLEAEGAAATFDMAFIDADKANADAYYEKVLILLRQGGLLLVDNVLWSGQVVDSSVNDVQTVALRKLTVKARDDERVDSSLVAIGDGLLLVRKR